jgi:hypothetical protein
MTHRFIFALTITVRITTNERKKRRGTTSRRVYHMEVAKAEGVRESADDESEYSQSANGL